MTIPEISRKTKIPENTLRRYAKEFPEFFPCRKIDRFPRYPADVMATAQRIRDLFERNHSKGEIVEFLQREVPVILDADVEEEEENKLQPVSGDWMMVSKEFMQQITETIAALAGKLDAMEEVKTRLASLETTQREIQQLLPIQAENQSLKEQVQALESELQAMKQKAEAAASLALQAPTEEVRTLRKEAAEPRPGLEERFKEREERLGVSIRGMMEVEPQFPSLAWWKRLLGQW